MFCFPNRGPRGTCPTVFSQLIVDVLVNKTKFERNCCLEYYYVTCIGKTKHTS